MKIFIRINKLFLILVIGSLLISCGGGGGGNTLPPEPTIIPTGSISINAQLGPIKNADVIVYDYSKGIILNENILSQATQITDSNGKYTIDIQTISTPILVCVRKGSYSEEASALSKKIDVLLNSDSLCAVMNYVSGEKINTNITFFTHVAYGLTNNKISNGAKVVDAINSANQTINNWLGTKIDILTTIPKQITNPNSIPASINNPLTAEHQYGFANAAISQLMKWVAKKNKIPAFTNVTSIIFAQRAFEDISADGILDGKAGVNQLAIVEPITEDLYRHKLALNMLIMAAAPENNSTLTVDNVFSYAESINNYSELSLNQNPTTVLTKSSPIINVTNPNLNDVIFGNALINPANNTPFDPLSNAFVAATITDTSVIDSLTITINKSDGSVQTTLQSNDLNQVKIPFDSKLIPDGNYIINVTATNIIGKTTSFAPINISVGNTLISAIINSPKPDSANGGAAIIVSGIVTEPANTPLKLIELKLDGKILPLDQAIDLTSTTNLIKATINSTNLPGLSDGPHSLDLTVVSTIASRGQTSDNVIFNIDNLKPIISSPAISPLNNQNLPIFANASTVNVQYTISDPIEKISGYSSGLNYAELLISGSIVGARLINLTQNLTVKFNPLSTNGGNRNYIEGWHDMVMNAYDNTGNKIQNSTIIGIDSNVPQISLNSSSVKNNNWVKNINIDGIAVDSPGTGISKVDILLDQIQIPISTTNGPSNVLTLPISERLPSLTFTHFIKTSDPNSSIVDGSHVIKIKATDYGGNFSDQVLNVYVDNLNPTISLISGATDPSLKPYQISYDTNTGDNTPKFGNHIAKCFINTTSSDPGYATLVKTGSGLFKQEIYVADGTNNIPNQPTTTKLFTQKNSETLSTPATVDGIYSYNRPFSTSRTVVIKTYDQTSNNINKATSGENINTMYACLNVDMAVVLNSNPANSRFCALAIGIPCYRYYDYTPTCSFTPVPKLGSCKL
ncbi:MAG: hypothetical protein ACC657_12860 [Thiohalomonadales bacterium]